MERFSHSSCILGNSLYVYGGNDVHGYDAVGSMLSIERLTNINKGIGKASNCWESLQIFARDNILPLMIPLNNSEKILILGNERLSF